MLSEKEEIIRSEIFILSRDCKRAKIVTSRKAVVTLAGKGGCLVIFAVRQFFVVVFAET